MRGMLLGGLAVLLAAGMAHGFVLTPESTTLAPEMADQQIVLNITGDEAGVTGLTIFANWVDAEMSPVTGPVFTGHIAKAGTVMAGSSLEPDPPILFGDPEGTAGIMSDFGMGFSGASFAITSTPQVGRILIVSTVGVAPGDYILEWSGSSIVGTSGIEGVTQAIITVTPEPAALALLALGGLFIRRRHA